MSEKTQSKNKQQENNIASKLKSLDQVTYLKQDWLIKNIPYFLFIGFLAIAYIWNAHHGVKMVKEIGDVQKQLVESEYYYNATKDTLTRTTRQSSVAELLKDENLFELTSPVKTIIIE